MPFLLEIGTEELPSGDLADAMSQLEAGVEERFREARLGFDQIKVFGTPRRLILYIPELGHQQLEQVQIERGPPEDRAFDAEGKPTKAAIGFAKGKGVPVEELQVKDLEGGRYLVAEVRAESHLATEVLTQLIPELIASLQFKKAMRWNASQAWFSRPIRWLLALHGDYVIPFEYAGVYSDRRTRLLRFSDPNQTTVKDAPEYFSTLDDEGIIIDPEARMEIIRKQINQAAKDLKAEIEDDPNLLQEVTNLVEKPTTLVGKFDQAYLALPKSVLISVMKVHQRYFPIVQNGKLLPHFLVVRNGGQDQTDRVIHGNEQVIGARFADAAYFIEQDLKEPLESYVQKLNGITFQSDLGSVRDKVGRIEQLTREFSEILNLDRAAAEVAQRAAHLCKADLATRMVIEMTALQGDVGRIYAVKSGESDDVGAAIFEHYLPRFSGDKLPATPAGISVGLADRVDTLMGLFAVGMQPTGTKDPFALRRTAIGLIQNLVQGEIHLDLRDFMASASSNLPVTASNEQQVSCMEFIKGRQQRLLLDAGHAHDSVEAVLAAQAHNPASAHTAVVALSHFRDQENWLEILQSFSRCVRITRDQAQRFDVNPDKLQEPSEKELYQAVQEARGLERQSGSVEGFFQAFIPLVPKITAFFDETLVMAEDDEIREIRLGLLQSIVALSDDVLDFSKLEGF